MFDMSFGTDAGFGTGAGDMAGDGLESMYQEVILDAARNPHGKTHFESTDALAKAELQEESQESAKKYRIYRKYRICRNHLKQCSRKLRCCIWRKLCLRAIAPIQSNLR